LQEGDIIVIDAQAGTIDVELSDADSLDARQLKPSRRPSARFDMRFAQNVGPARRGGGDASGAGKELRCYAGI